LRWPILREACASLSAAFSRHWSAVNIIAGSDQKRRTLSDQNRPLSPTQAAHSP
jgi:hypothetical protein